ncbi:MAG: 2,3-bisphosphoglycerate-independent phosphoglycerate mutase [Anaerolineales bacterium]
MTDLDLARELRLSATTKIVLLVLDGLGGLPRNPGEPTELEAARTPNLDDLTQQASLGQLIPVRPGVTPGSGPAHLALFGYDPLVHRIGRGVLEAAGVGLRVGPGDVAARGNLVTLDSQGRIGDRRAGRIPTEEAAPVIERLQKISIQKATFEVRHVREYRFVVVLRGPGYSAEIEDTDPQTPDLPPHPARARNPAAEPSATLFRTWIEAASRELAEQTLANGLTLRGFATDPSFPQFPEIYGLRAACVAVYPMYRGVASLVGMNTLSFEGERPEDEFGAVVQAAEAFDFFFVHIKKTDSRGEDGDFDGKVAEIEAVDAALPSLLRASPAVLAVTGDHSTPARLRTHSWHPVPLLLWAPATARSGPRCKFGESSCARGNLGTLPASGLMSLLMAHAQRWGKFGA